MRRRLVLAIAGVATAAVVLLAVPLAVVLRRDHRDADLLRLQRDTVAATRQIDLTPGARDPIEVPPSRDVLGVYDAAGRRVAGRGPARAPAVVRRALASGRPADETGGTLVVAVPLLSGERVTGAVLAERAEGEASGDTGAQWLALGGIALGIVAAAVLAALWLGHVLSRPLERLAAAATRLGGGDFSVRAPPAGIPEVDAVGSALATTAGRLEDLVGRERAFSADASHQLRTPLQALRLELEAADLRGDASPEVLAALAQVDRLETTISTLLAVARDAPREGRAARLGALVDAAEARWHGHLAAGSRPMRIAMPAGPLVARADPNVVAEILDVLLDNAERHGAGVVTVAVRDLDGWIAVDVGDEGAGFDGDPERAFARRTGTTDGHGIGLALARSLAHAEGGRLQVSRAAPRPVLTLLLRAAGRDDTGEGTPPPPLRTAS